jgi:hypothetical protein
MWISNAERRMDADPPAVCDEEDLYVPYSRLKKNKIKIKKLYQSINTLGYVHPIANLLCISQDYGMNSCIHAILDYSP